MDARVSLDRLRTLALSAALAWSVSACQPEAPVAAAQSVDTQPAANAPTTLTSQDLATLTAAPVVARRELGGGAFVIEDMGRAPEGRAADVIAQLEPMARAGDASASYAIFLKLDQCDSRRRVVAEGGAPDSSAYAECWGLDTAEYAARGEWLALSARQGNLAAQLLYSADPQTILGNEADMLRDPDALTRYKAQATRYLEVAASQGSFDALLRLANAYRAGVLVPEDFVRSYAHYAAAREISPDLVPIRQMEWVAEQLTPAQRASALNQGRSIRETCCSP